MLALLFTAGVACKSSTENQTATSTESDSTRLTLSQLKTGDQVKASGKQLMALPVGMHRLDDSTQADGDVIIGVHGHASKGYEWVYPLLELGKSGARVYFYRWDYDACPKPAAIDLARALDALVKRETDIKRVRLFSHSYGGVITALATESYSSSTPLEAHVIASPLAGHPALEARCGAFGTTDLTVASNVTLHQWRTRKHLDGAYRDLPVDPQVVDLSGQVTGDVTVLPEEYNGHRLGHNWSISWVVDHVGQTR